jgi:fibronectin-binding autotransporter adhesin
MPTIASETDLNTAISAANAGTPETVTFTTNVLENAAPTVITASGLLTLDGVNFALTGDGTDAALTLNPAATVTIENLGIANTGAGAAIATSAGSVVTFQSDGGAAATSTISAPITGAGAVHVNVTNNVANAVILNAANTYSGATTVAGYLAFGANGAIADSASVAVTGTLDISGAHTSGGAATVVAVNQLTGNGAIYVGGNSLQVTDTATGTTFSGIISDAAGAVTTKGGLTEQAGTLTLTGADTYTGATKVYGTLALGAGGSITGSSNVSLKASGATFDITNATGTVTVGELTGGAGSVVTLGANTLDLAETIAASFSGTIGGTGGLAVSGTAELLLAGANTYSGATTIASGATLGVSGSGSLNTSGISGPGAFDIASATGPVTVAALTTSGAVTLGDNRLVLTGASTPTGIISSTGAGGVQVGAAAGDGSTSVITTADTYTGSTVIYGALTLGVGGSIADTSNVSLKASGATFDITNATGPVVINELTGTGGTITLGANTLAVTEAVSASFGGVISGTGSLTLAGPATLTLTGANTYSGATTISSGGDLALSAGGTLSATAITDGGVFDISGVNSGSSMAGSILVSIASLASTTAAPGSVVLGGNTLNISAAGTTFAGVISGAGNLTIAAGTQTLTGANTYTGTTTVNGTLDLGTATVAGGSISGSTNIAGSGNIVVTNATLGVAGADTNTGNLTLTGGVLDISKASGDVTVSGLLTGQNGTLGGATVQSSIVLGSNNLILSGSPDEFTPDEFTGVISGAGGVVIGNNDGYLELTGAETYTGSTVVSSGELILVGSLATSNVSLKGDGLLVVDAVAGVTTAMITELTGQTGTEVYLFTNLLVNETIAATYSGVISGGSDNFALGGTATLTLAGVETYSGSTTINAGASLALMGAGSIVASSGLVDNGFFTVGATDTTVNALTGTGVVKMVTFGLTDKVTSTSTASTFSGAIHGASALTVSGLTTATASTHVTLSGTSDYSGGTVIAEGTLELASAHAVGAGVISFGTADAADVNNVLVIDNAALTGGGTATESFANTIGTPGTNDIIDLNGLTFNTAAPPVLSSSGNNQLVVTEGGVSVTLTLTGVTAANVSSYHAFQDSHGGTFISLSPTAGTDTTHFHP